MTVGVNKKSSYHCSSWASLQIAGFGDSACAFSSAEQDEDITVTKNTLRVRFSHINAFHLFVLIPIPV